MVVSRSAWENLVEVGVTDKGRKNLTQPWALSTHPGCEGQHFLVYVLPGAYETEIKAQPASVTKDLNGLLFMILLFICPVRIE